MSGEALYERYKDALKRGHVASLRGHLDEALGAYAEASAIAPDRPAPHTSAGTALLRRKRPAEALRYYALALRLAPRDESALLGRAQCLAALGRRPEAADAFDALAEVRASGGKPADAVDAARRGLELAEGRERRRTLARLIEQLRASEPDEPGRLALERALIALDGSLVGGPGGPAVAAPTEPGPADELSPAGEPGPEQAGEHEAGTDSVAAEPVEPPVLVRSALERDLPAGADLEDLARRSEAAMDAGDAATAVELLMDLAALGRNEGHAHAAMDACYTALSLSPDHVGLHLALVQLYEDQGWTGLATEKLDLLDRLVTLGEDDEGASRVAAARAGRR